MARSGRCASKCSCKKEKVIAWFKQPENILVLSIVGAVILAFCFIGPVRAANPSPRTIAFIKFPGDIFFNLMKMCILPVIICSILSGVTSLDVRTSGKLGIITLVYYLGTTVVASLIGCTLVTIIQPGKYGKKAINTAPTRTQRVSPADAMMDLFRNLFPENIVRATMEQVTTRVSNVSVVDENGAVNYEYKRSTDFVNGSNFMGLIFFCIFFGFVLLQFGKRAKPIVDMIQLLNDVVMHMMMNIIVFSPVGIFFLILATMAEFRDMGEILSSMGMMVLTTCIGLLMLWFIVYPGLYFIVVRKNPFKIILQTTRATIYAFMLTSSSATLPLTMRCCEEKVGVRKAVTRFMLPIGAIVNMDGTAVHEGAAALFIAQLNGIDQSFGEKLLVCLMGAVSSIACSTTPGAGIVALLIVLTTAGLPTDDIALFFMTDWIMSRVRTATNVLGDSFACAIVDKLCENELSRHDPVDCHVEACEECEDEEDPDKEPLQLTVAV